MSNANADSLRNPDSNHFTNENHSPNTTGETAVVDAKYNLTLFIFI